MTNKAARYGLMIIAAVLLAAMAFAGAGAAAGEYVKVWDGTALVSLDDGDVVAGDAGTATMEGTPGTDEPCILVLDGFTVDASSANTMIIDANVPNLIIKLKRNSDLKAGLADENHGAVNATGNLIIQAASGSNARLMLNNTVASGFARGIYASGISIAGTHTTVDVVTASGDSSAYAVFAANAISVEKATVDATATTGGSVAASSGLEAYNGDMTVTGAKITAKASGGDCQTGIASDSGTVAITDGSRIEIEAYSDCDDAYGSGIYAYDDLEIADSQVEANITSCMLYAIYTPNGDIRITDTSIIDAYGYSDYADAYGYGVYAHEDLEIADSQVTANITCSMPFAMYSKSGNLTVTDATVDAVAETPEAGGGPQTLYVYDEHETGLAVLRISHSVVHAAAIGGEEAYAIKSFGDVVIEDDSYVEAKADTDETGASGYGILAYLDIDITDSQVTANSTGTYLYMIYTPNGEIRIADKSIIAAYGHSDSPDGTGYGIYAYEDLNIADSQITANLTCAYPNVMESAGGNVVIEDGCVVDVYGYSDYAGTTGYGIYAHLNLDIADSQVMANSTCSYPNPVYAYYGNLTITDATVDAVAEALGEGCPHALYVYDEINGGLVDLTISHSVVHATAIGGGETYAIKSYGDIVIEDDSYLETKTDTDESYASGYGIYAYYDLEIADSRVTANSTCDYPYVLYSSGGNILITDGSIIAVYGYSDDAGATGYGITAYYDIDFADSQVTANLTCAHQNVMYSSDGNISIADGSAVEVYGYSDYAEGYGYGIYANYDIDIADSLVTGNLTCNSLAVVYSSIGNITIADGSAVEAYGYGAYAYGIYADDYLEINASTVDVITMNDGADPDYTSYPILTYDYDVIISNNSVVRAAANGINGYAILATNELILDNPRFVSAFGTASSFAYHIDGGKDIASLQEGYAFLNATDPGAEPASFDAFSNDWHIVENLFYIGYTGNASNYTSVVITKGTQITLDPNGGECDTPAVTALYGTSLMNTTVANPTGTGMPFAGWYDAPSRGTAVIDTHGSLIPGADGYTDADGNWIYNGDALTLYAHWKKSSSSGQTGSTIILTETPTPAATSAPADAPTVLPSAKPTQQQTQASPAPVAGLIAGLGIAGLVLRLRK